MKHWSDMGELGIDLSQKFPCLSRKYSCSKINFQKKISRAALKKLVTLKNIAVSLEKIC